MAVRAFKDSRNRDVGFVEMPDSTTEEQWALILIEARINYSIKNYQLKAGDLIRSLYVANTLAGITTAQSDQMFDDFEDVLVRLREGAWPTALFRLATKTPVGFVTQDLINKWTVLITEAL